VVHEPSLAGEQEIQRLGMLASRKEVLDCLL
jgi:hypothetical protein